MPTKVGLAGGFVLMRISHRCLAIVSYRRQVVAARMASSLIVPVGPDFQDLIQTLLVYHVKAVQSLLLYRLDDTVGEPPAVWVI